MTLVARRPQSHHTPAPAGLHEAVCVDVVNLGQVPTAWGQKHKVRLVWQIATTDPDHGKRFELTRVYTLSLAERAALRHDLENWRGRKFTDAELEAGFDVEKVIGANCQLQAVQEPGDDGNTYANVTAVLAPRKGTPKLTALDYVRHKDRQPARGAAPQKGGDDVGF